MNGSLIFLMVPWNHVSFTDWSSTKASKRRTVKKQKRKIRKGRAGDSKCGVELMSGLSYPSWVLEKRRLSHLSGYG